MTLAAPTSATRGSLRSRSASGPRIFSAANTLKPPRGSSPKSVDAIRRSLRREMAAEISSSEHTVTCTTTSALRSREGR